jgi:hypothetical protein
MICGHCIDGLVAEGNSYYTCTYCYEKRALIEDIELSIAILVSRDEIFEAKELAKIHDLLESSPILALMEAEHQKLSGFFIEKMIKVFNIKRIQ